MSKVVITKDEQGRLRGHDEASERAYARWRRMVVVNRFLWPALDAEQQYRCMESFAEEFER